ncbi:ComF family protein [Chakrabartyella piscis]|uniref:ComF family protein n=1 Tax=Chakrabartyella piscis TaxID=2918914 RepID=UPI0029587BC7|nr:ComF family protein [Chakrabartyella piscis]
MSFEEIVDEIREYIMYVFFPPYCVICGKHLHFAKWDQRLCAHCEQETPYIQGDVCEICGKPAIGGTLCEQCLRKRPVFTKACAAFVYDDVRKGIARYKYSGGKVDGDTYGILMAEYLLQFHKDWIAEMDFITPVPLHPKKQRKRGFNQSGILCEWISEICDIPYEEDVLQRTKNTKPQSKLDGKKRESNLKGVFTAQKCKDKAVLLVDDIFTTGTTANECSKELYRKGAKEVRIFCLSHTKG